MSRVITLTSPPDLRRLYASAVFHRGNHRNTLPDEQLALNGIRVGLEDLVDYSRLCGFGLTGTLPLTYPHRLGFPLQMTVMAGHGFPLPLLGAVHVENVITVRRPLNLDDRLDLVVRAENLRAHRRGRQVDLVTEVSVAGDPAWRGVSTYLARGREHPDVRSSSTPSCDRATPRPGPVWRFGANDGRRYACVSGDWNPIHLCTLTARPLGFSTAIAHGMFTYARVVAALASRLPEAGLTSQVWFRRPVPLPSTVRLSSVVDPRHALSRLESEEGHVEHALVEHRW